MNGHVLFVRTARAIAVTLSFCTTVSSALGTETDVIRTNLVERWITNLIEIRMPLNRFVNEYQTNWVTQFHTNRINVYVTNRLTRTVTNQIVVAAFRTNFVAAYQTNWTTLDLTNWQTAIVMKTNRVTQMVTNEVQIDLPSPSVAPATATAVDSADQEEPRIEAPASPPDASLASPIVLEAARTARLPINGQVEVSLKVRARGDSALDLQVQKWRVEREDRAILCFGQDKEFKRELPAGRYKVDVKIRQTEDGNLITARGMLVVTPGEVVIQQNLAARR